MKKLFFALFLFLLTLFIPKATFGQGIYLCQPDAGGGCKVSNLIQDNRCEDGYRPGGDCSQFNNTECVGKSFSCIRDTGATACAEDYGGTCSHTLTCGSNSRQFGSSGQYCELGSLCCVPTGSVCNQLGGTCKHVLTCGSEQNVQSGDPSCALGSICCAPKTSNSSDSLKDLTCDGGTGIATAIGCIPIDDPNAFLGFFLKWAIGIGGGVAFLLIGYSAIMIMTSSGNPDRLKAGQELLTSALMGVVLIVFSVFILKVIGVDILKIPGFSTKSP